MADYSIKAVIRKDQGKSYARKIRKMGKVPGVVYGPSAEPKSIELNMRELELLHRNTFGKNAIINLDLDGSESMVMFKNVQREPVKSKMLHVDFYLLQAGHELNLDVPIILDGIAAGVKEGGILSHGVRAIHVRCLPKDIPKAIHVDISALKVEENILVQNLTPPPGVTFLTDEHAMIAHVSEVKEEEVKEEAAAEADPKAAAKPGAKAGDPKAADAKAGDAKPDDKGKAKK